jgi:hypothetical protein
MQNIQKYFTMSKLNQKTWIAVSVQYDDVDALLSTAITGLLNKVKHLDAHTTFMFSRGQHDDRHVLLLFKIAAAKQTQAKAIIDGHLLPYLRTYAHFAEKIPLPVTTLLAPGEGNALEYIDYDFPLQETGGVDASYAAEKILSTSSQLIVDFMAETKTPWNSNHAKTMAIQLHLALAHTFLLDMQECAAFFSYCFDKLLRKNHHHQANESLLLSLLYRLESAYQQQKMLLAPISESVLSRLLEEESIEDAWLEEWIMTCKSTYSRILKLQHHGQFSIPSCFQFDSSLDIPRIRQERWPVIEQYIKSIHSQLGLEEHDELSLLYFLTVYTMELQRGKNVCLKFN